MPVFKISPSLHKIDILSESLRTLQYGGDKSFPACCKSSILEVPVLIIIVLCNYTRLFIFKVQALIQEDICVCTPSPRFRCTITVQEMRRVVFPFCLDQRQIWIYNDWIWLLLKLWKQCPEGKSFTEELQHRYKHTKSVWTWLQFQWHEVQEVHAED